MGRTWDAVRRLVQRNHPNIMPIDNPFRGVEMDLGDENTAVAASRAKAFALH